MRDNSEWKKLLLEQVTDFFIQAIVKTILLANRGKILNKLSTLEGQTLIEVLVALAAAAIIIFAVSVSVISSLNNAQYSKNQNLATKYSQEGMEIVRQLRDGNYQAFANADGVYCLDKGTASLGSPVGSCTQPNVDNFFIRSVDIQQSSAVCGGSLASVTVTTAWVDGKCQPNVYCNKAQQISCFSIVNPVQAP